MSEAFSRRNLVAEIEGRQQEVLRELDELNQRIEKTLGKYGTKENPSGQGSDLQDGSA